MLRYSEEPSQLNGQLRLLELSYDVVRERFVAYHGLSRTTLDEAHPLRNSRKNRSDHLKIL